MRRTVAFVLGTLFAYQIANPCCSIGRGGGKVTFTNQVNLIIWDKERKIEHFVRNASFSTDAQDLAFIAPTPSIPEFKQVDPSVFDSLAHLRRQAEEREAYDTRSADVAKGATAPVTVVKEEDIAGYHAVTLKASDSTSLVKWLQSNNYPLSPGIKEWVDRYVKKNWYLTAFKVIPRSGKIETGLVRLSFATDKPFNPYYVSKENVPADGEKSGLELYFLAQAEYEGKIDGSDGWVKPEITFNLITGKEKLDALLDIPRDQLEEDYEVTCFRDPQFPVADKGDIFFTPTPDSQKYHPHHRYTLDEIIARGTTILIIGGPIAYFLVLFAKARRQVKA